MKDVEPDQDIKDAGEIVDKATGGLLHDTVDRIVDHTIQDVHDLHELERENPTTQDSAGHESSDHEGEDRDGGDHDGADRE